MGTGMEDYHGDYFEDAINNNEQRTVRAAMDTEVPWAVG